MGAVHDRLAVFRLAKRARAPRAKAAMRETTLLTLPPTLKENPYQRLLYSHLAECGFSVKGNAKLRTAWLWRHRRAVGILHFHWPQPYYRVDGRHPALRPALRWIRLLLFTLRLNAARLLGYRIVWTVHQVMPHDKRYKRDDTLAARTLAHFSDVLIAHDTHTRETIRSLLGEAAFGKVAIIPHGSYVGIYLTERSKTDVRRDLGIDDGAFVFLYFGELKAYKHVPLLLDAFHQLERRDIVLIIAGPPRDTGIAYAVKQATDADLRLRSILEFVPDNKVADLFVASDVFVLPRGDGGSSGSLILSLSLATPIICADFQAYRSLTRDGDAGWYFSARNAASLSAAMTAAAASSRSDLDKKRKAAQEQAASLDWRHIAEQTASVLLAQR